MLSRGTTCSAALMRIRLTSSPVGCGAEACAREGSLGSATIAQKAPHRLRKSEEMDNNAFINVL
jgi:hypothetical protein